MTSVPEADYAGVLKAVDAKLDHVAHAVPSIQAVLPLYRDILGGVEPRGGIHPTAGHIALQFSYPGGGKIELLEPTSPNSLSIGKFLAANPRGGLHHVTFRVEDLRAALEVVEGAGFTPFGTSFATPMWFESYLHPRQTGGALIQLAQAPASVPPVLELSVEEMLARAAEIRQAADEAADGVSAR